MIQHPTPRRCLSFITPVSRRISSCSKQSIRAEEPAETLCSLFFEMSDVKSYFSKLAVKYSGSEEEKLCCEIIFTDIDISMGDKRLNNLTARTYNAASCEKIFAMLEKALSPQENPWKTLYKALLVLHTIILYGSELAIDKCISLCRIVNPLQQYNSALVKKGFFSVSGGSDYGAPVRMEAKIIDSILINDNNIRQARNEARNGQNSLVPMGSDTLLSMENHNPSSAMGTVTFGQGLETSVGAGFGLQNVPGMYEGRPERYFDNSNDPRKRHEAQDSQYTRDCQAPSLLDLVFDAPQNSAANLPEAQYLPALEKQRELERQLAEQTAQLKQLQDLQRHQAALQQAQHSVHQSNTVYNHNAPNLGAPQYGMTSDSLLDMGPITSAPIAILHHNSSGGGFPSTNNSVMPQAAHMGHPYAPTTSTFGSLHDLNTHASASAILHHNNPVLGGVVNIGQGVPAGYIHAHQQQQQQQQPVPPLHSGHSADHSVYIPVHGTQIPDGPRNSAGAAFMPVPSVPHGGMHSGHVVGGHHQPQGMQPALPQGYGQQSYQQQQPFQQQHQPQAHNQYGMAPPVPSIQHQQQMQQQPPPSHQQYGMAPPPPPVPQQQYGNQMQQQPYQQHQNQQQQWQAPTQAPPPPPVPPRAPGY